MTIRQRAHDYLRRKGAPDGHLVTSKYYQPDESWTAEKAWWVRIPLAPVRAGKLIHIVLQANPGSGDFRHLAVPAEYFLRHLQGFSTLAPDTINLFLAAATGMEFVDQRGPGKVSFARFESDHIGASDA